MAKLFVYDAFNNRFYTYDLNENDPMPYSYGSTLKLREFRGSSGANVLWTIAYDTYYAMVDREDDRRIGVKSTAILFGRYDLLMIALLQVTTLLTLLLVGWLQQLNGLFYASVLVAAALFVYQGVSARNRDRQACFQAFLANNWVGCVIFGGILLSTALT